MTKSTGVLFDLDGVIVDTESIYTVFWDKIDQKYRTGIKDFALIIKGSNLQTILDTYFPSKSAQESILTDISDFEKTMKYRIFEGALEFVDELRQRNIPSCIVTSSSMEKMEQLFKQHPCFMNHFDGLVTGDMVKHCKPHPECYLMGAKKINRNIEDCYVFEDSLQGIEAGINAGSKVIALATTLKESQIDKKANKIINNFIGFNVNQMLTV